MEITEENIMELAMSGRVEVLNHPSVDKVKDDFGVTPLHYLANIKKVKVLNHPSVDKVKDEYGWTPLHILAGKRKVTEKHLKKLYPWFEVKDRKIDVFLIDEILNTPQSIQFIKSTA